MSDQLRAAAFEPGRYIVEFVDDSVAVREGETNPLARAAGSGSVDFDSPSAVAYAAELESEQAAAAEDAGVSSYESLTASFNGIIADLTSEQAYELFRNKNVAKLTPNDILQIQEAPATEYLQLEEHFAQIGGWEGAGDGVVVGVLDTGIAPENPFFAGEPLGTAAGAEPYLADGVINFAKNDGGTFTGVCEEGAQFTADLCNTKLVGARYYVDGFGAERVGPESIGEYISPRDGNGHGSHTASTAAGNADVAIHSMGGADLGTMSGVAPSAKVSSYKVCWEGPDPEVTTDDGCATSDLIAGIEQATLDGVDVINFSIGGGAASTVWDPIDQAFFGAAAAGIFVSASAGNSGPDAVTADHAAPWYATVAAATVPNFEGEVVLEDGTTFPGASVTVPMEGAEGVSAPLVYAGDIPAENATEAQAALCLPGSIDAELAADTIVLCDRGENARVEKSQVTNDAGAVGTIVVNVISGDSLDLDDHFNPTVHVAAEHRDALLEAAASGDQVVTLQEAEERTAIAPQIAGFSSRGPMLADGSDVVKPDIAAPGVGIIAAGPNALGADPTYVFMSGTSMAAPHVAGLGAAYLGAHPQASPAEVKSVLTTSTIDTVNADGGTVTDAFAQGSGMVQADGMLNAGFFFEADMVDYAQYLVGAGVVTEDEAGVEGIDPSDLNLPSIGIGALMYEQTVTRTATAISAGSYSVDVAAPAGIDVVVEPSTLNFSAAGETQEYTVTLTNSGAEIGAWSQGRLVWSDGAHQVRQPIAVRAMSVVTDDRIVSDKTWDVQPVDVSAATVGTLSVNESGLTPAATVWDGEPAPETGDPNTTWYDNGDLEHLFELEEGTELLVIETDSVDDATDYDLIVGHFSYDFELQGRWESGAAGSAEAVELTDPEPGIYLALTYDYNGTMGPVTLKTTQVTPENGEGDFTTSFLGASTADAGNAVNAFDVEIEERGEYDAQVSWVGLETDQQYYGLITAELGGASEHTVVDVLATEERPEPALDEIADQTVELGEAIADVTPALLDEDGEALAADVTVEGLPEGVTFADGVISGTPEAAGTYEVTVTAVHELGFESSVTFTITVTEPEPEPSEPGPSEPGPSEPGPSEPGPSEPGPSEPGPSAPEPTDPADPQPTEVPGDGDLPRTGGDAALWLLLVAAGIALAGAGFVVVRRRTA